MSSHTLILFYAITLILYICVVVYGIKELKRKAHKHQLKIDLEIQLKNRKIEIFNSLRSKLCTLRGEIVPTQGQNNLKVDADWLEIDELIEELGKIIV